MVTRLKPFLKPNVLEVGLDEVARGCLIGRVYAAAVVWNPDIEHIVGYNPKISGMIDSIRDSKKIKPEKRKELAKFIENYSIACSVAWVDEREIDKINIRNASLKAMHLALDKLPLTPQHLIVDGNAFNDYNDIPHTTVIKGDDKYISIAAASILAKTYRDEYLMKLVDDNPSFEVYDLRNNSGYGTKNHLNAIKKYGITHYHQKHLVFVKNMLRKLGNNYCGNVIEN